MYNDFPCRENDRRIFVKQTGKFASKKMHKTKKDLKFLLIISFAF